MRKRYFPQCAFDQCVVLRGVLPNLVHDIQSGEGQAIVMMWRKNTKVKRLYAAGLEFVDIKDFNPSAWSMVIMYNRGGGTVGKNNVIPRPSAEAPTLVPPDDVEGSSPAPEIPEPPLPPPAEPPPPSLIGGAPSRLESLRPDLR